MEYVVLEAESRGRKFRAVVHFSMSPLLRRVVWRRHCYLSPDSPGLAVSLLGSAVRTVFEEAGFLRDSVKSLGNSCAALGPEVLELRGKPVYLLLHGTWPSLTTDTWKTDSNIRDKKTALQRNTYISTWHQGDKW